MISAEGDIEMHRFLHIKGVVLQIAEYAGLATASALASTSRDFKLLFPNMLCTVLVSQCCGQYDRCKVMSSERQSLLLEMIIHRHGAENELRNRSKQTLSLLISHLLSS